MQISTGWSSAQDSATAAREAVEQATRRLDGPPHYLLSYITASHDANEARAALVAAAPSARLHGATSCLGTMTDQGFHGFSERVLSVWAVYDPRGAYATGQAAFGEDPAAASLAALEQALASSSRSAELPAAVWVTSTPGSEEEVIEGLKRRLGDRVLIAGGSAADDQLEGGWRVFTHEGVQASGVAVSLLYPDAEVSHFFHNGYSTTGISGVATRAEGRVVHEIDGLPAAEVYGRWTRGAIQADAAPGTTVLNETAVAPLGLEVASVDGIENFQLCHPSAIGRDRSLEVMANVRSGTRVHLMRGDRQSLASRARRVTDTAIDIANFQLADVIGGITSCCAGSMMILGDDMKDVARSLHAALGARPFVGSFSFGEQGQLADSHTCHGNLMISQLVFANGH